VDHAFLVAKRDHGQEIPWFGDMSAKKIILKIKTNFLKKSFQKKFFVWYKENFEKYSLILKYAKLSFPILNIIWQRSADPTRRLR
jgi:hypothetical protein